MVIKDVINIIENEFFQNEKNLEILDSVIFNERPSSTALIARLMILKRLGSPRYIEELKKCSVFVQSRKKLFEKLNSSKIDTKNSMSEDFKYTFFEWIDKMRVKNDNQSNKIEPEFFSSVKLAKKSILENDDFVTETLANIYFNQGHYNKAIDAFKKLILKFPEKSTLFANKIEEINKINNYGD